MRKGLSFPVGKAIYLEIAKLYIQLWEQKKYVADYLEKNYFMEQLYESLVYVMLNSEIYLRLLHADIPLI